MTMMMDFEVTIFWGVFIEVLSYPYITSRAYGTQPYSASPCASASLVFMGIYGYSPSVTSPIKT